MVLTLVGLLMLTAAPPPASTTTNIHIGDAGAPKAPKLTEAAAVAAARQALTDRKVDTSKLVLDAPAVRTVADGSNFEVTFKPREAAKGGTVIVQIDGQTGAPQIGFE